MFGATRRLAVGRWTTATVLVLAALATVAAGVPSSAAAAGPEFKVCVKAQPKKSGKYTSNSCSDSSFVAAGGQKYEREGFPFTNARAKEGADGGQGTARWTIVNPAGGGGGPTERAGVVLEPKCPAVEGVGARGGSGITGPKTVLFNESFEECFVTKEGWKCTGGSLKKHHIQTDQLEGTLVYLNAAHTRVGMRVKGLGPGGRLMSYGCGGGANLVVGVYGEYLAEVTGDTNSASKTFTVVAGQGALGLQSPMYEEEAFSESQGKEVLEWNFSLEACEHGEPPYAAGEKTEAECVSIIGPAPVAEPPVTLTAVVSGAARARYPMVQETTTVHKVGKFLVETS